MAENPYESTDQAHGKKPPQSALAILGKVVLVGLLLMLLVALLLPATRSARPAARRNACLNNTKQILLALQNYHDTKGELPPAYTVDENGNRLHSWRTLLLPFMEGTTIYEKIDLTKPWDDPANAEARESIGHPYLCPSAAIDEDQTTYLAVVGPEFLFGGPTPRTMEEVVDGASNTIAVLDVSIRHAVHWMSPEDVNEETLLNTEKALNSAHPNVFMAGYLDGHVDALPDDIDRSTLRKMLTIAGRESIGEDE